MNKIGKWETRKGVKEKNTRAEGIGGKLSKFYDGSKGRRNG